MYAKKVSFAMNGLMEWHALSFAFYYCLKNVVRNVIADVFCCMAKNQGFFNFISWASYVTHLANNMLVGKKIPKH